MLEFHMAQMRKKKKLCDIASMQLMQGFLFSHVNTVMDTNLSLSPLKCFLCLLLLLLIFFFFLNILLFSVCGIRNLW